jgi:hypothetical protein
MKKLLLTAAVLALTTTAFAANEGKDHKTERTESEKARDDAKLKQVGTAGAAAKQSAALGRVTQIASNLGVLENGSDAKDAKEALSNSVAKNEVTNDDLAVFENNSTSELAKGTFSMLAEGASQGANITQLMTFVRKSDIQSALKGQSTANEKMVTAVALIARAFKNGTKVTKEAITVGLEQAGIDGARIKEILEICFGIK